MIYRYSPPEKNQMKWITTAMLGSSYDEKFGRIWEQNINDDFCDSTNTIRQQYNSSDFEYIYLVLFAVSITC